MNRLRWVDRKTGKAEDVTLHFDAGLPMAQVQLSLDAIARGARWEIRPGR